MAVPILPVLVYLKVVQLATGHRLSLQRPLQVRNQGIVEACGFPFFLPSESDSRKLTTNAKKSKTASQHRAALGRLARNRSIDRGAGIAHVHVQAAIATGYGAGWPRVGCCKSTYIARCGRSFSRVHHRKPRPVCCACTRRLGAPTLLPAKRNLRQCLVRAVLPSLEKSLKEPLQGVRDLCPKETIHLTSYGHNQHKLHSRLKPGLVEVIAPSLKVGSNLSGVRMKEMFAAQTGTSE